MTYFEKYSNSIV